MTRFPTTHYPATMTPDTKLRLAVVAELFRGKEMFPRLNQRARELFRGLK